MLSTYLRAHCLSYFPLSFFLSEKLLHCFACIIRRIIQIRGTSCGNKYSRSYTWPTTPFPKPLYQTSIVRTEQTRPLKKPLRVAQSNSRGTDCRNFAVASTIANSCWSLLQTGNNYSLFQEEVQLSSKVEQIAANSRDNIVPCYIKGFLRAYNATSEHIRLHKYLKGTCQKEALGSTLISIF